MPTAGSYEADSPCKLVSTRRPSACRKLKGPLKLYWSHAACAGAGLSLDPLMGLSEWRWGG
jgi:hypothetical protein